VVSRCTTHDLPSMLRKGNKAKKFPKASSELIGGTVAGLLGRAERSSPNAAWRRAEGAGLDGEDADRAIISVTALRVVVGPYQPPFRGRRRCRRLAARVANRDNFSGRVPLSTKKGTRESASGSVRLQGLRAGQRKTPPWASVVVGECGGPGPVCEASVIRGRRGNARFQKTRAPIQSVRLRPR
jgi:hypothetical protein